MLIGRQLLYSSNTTSTVATNLTALSTTTDKINRISNHFWDRWRHEYVVNLRETQRTSELNMKRFPHRFGELPLTGLLPDIYSEKRGAIVRIVTSNVP